MNKCEHKNVTIPAHMSWPKFGIVCSVLCADCGEITNTCWWEETSPLKFELIYGPPKKPTGTIVDE